MPKYHLKDYIVPFILLIIVSGLIFSNTLNNPFMWDEKEFIVENSYTKGLKDAPFLFSPVYWRHYYPGAKEEYRPIGVVTFVLDYCLWKLKPFGYHLTNLLLHILNVILIYLVILRLVNRNKEERGLTGLPFLAALLFATHPIHTESIAWIKNRFDLLSLLFLLLSLLFFIRYISQKEGRGIIIYYIISIFSFILALLSKETAVVLPFVLSLYVICFLGKKVYKKALVGILPFFGFMSIYIIFKLKDLINLVSGEIMHNISVYQNILIVIKTIGYYIRLLVFPIDLNAEHFLGVPKSFFEPAVILSLVLLLILTAIVIKTFRYSKMLSFGIMWILLTLIPASNIIFLAGRPIAEQRLYTSSLGFCIILAMGIRALPSLGSRFIHRNMLRRSAVFLTLCILIFYSTVTIRRNFDWKDPATFWTKTVKSSQNSARAYNNLGTAYYNTGRYQDAIASYEKAIDIDPKFATACNNLGAAYRNIGDDDKAISAFKKAVELNPDYAEAYSNLGVALYAKSGLSEEVLMDLRRAIELNPNYAEAYNNLAGVLQAEFGRISQVEVLYKRAIELNPNYAEAYYNLGLFCDSSGLYNEALGYYKKAVGLKPDYADAYNNIGALYRDLGERDNAIEYLTKAIEVDPRHIKAHRTLALIFYDMGLMAQAKSHWEKILEIDPNNEDAKKGLLGIQKTEE